MYIYIYILVAAQPLQVQIVSRIVGSSGQCGQDYIIFFLIIYISPTIGATATTMRRPTALRIGVMDNGNGARSLPRMTPVTLAPFRRTRGTRRRATSPRKPTRR